MSWSRDLQKCSSVSEILRSLKLDLRCSNPQKTFIPVLCQIFSFDLQYPSPGFNINMSKSSHHHDHHGHHSHQHPPAPKHHGGTAPSEGITTQHLRFHYHHRHHHPSALPESSRQVITAAAEINTADADTDLKSGLVINSSIKPFDMIVALSQNSINASLSYLWSKQPKGTPTPGASFSSFNYINISNPKAKTSIVGSLKAPTVQLTVQNGPAREVLFLLAFGDDANFNFVNVDYENEELCV